MKVKVSDYIAAFLVKNGVEHVFTVVGGGAMHLNASIGCHPQLTCIYNHHEQASSMAAECYYRVKNKMAGLCVTSGPGAVNALNGVIGAYQDSIPMIVLSGQTKTSLMTRNSGLCLRTLGNQEYDIIPTLQNATKYAETVMDAEDIKYCLEKAFYIAKTGRPGPCWVEVPIDIQGAFVEEEKLKGYTVNYCNKCRKQDTIEQSAKVVYAKLKNAKRPVIYAGHGIRIADAKEIFVRMVETLKIPVVTCWNSIDLIATDDAYYTGRAGIMGDRAGNFAVQNSDMILAIGNRLNIYQVGYQPDLWAREAYVVHVDIDSAELKKPTIRVDLPICGDAKYFMELLYKAALDEPVTDNFCEWREQCQIWKRKYPVVQEKHYCQQEPVNVYAFMDKFSRMLPQNAISVVANGSASVVGSAAYYIKNNQRFIMNCAFSSMGYDLPAAIGAAAAWGKDIFCIAGDGSIMMNIQELQTIVTNNLPVKIVVINNEGYHQIRLTQANAFDNKYVGIGPESNDLGFPDFIKLAKAFGIPGRRCRRLSDLEDAIAWLLKEDMYCLLEVICDTKQIFEPKSATRFLDDGTMISPPLEDLAPFLDRKELKDNMIIPMI